MDSEMIERCAEAYGGCKLSEWHPNVQEQIKETVVKIIKAMREPTKKMLEVGNKAVYDCFSLEPGEGFDEPPAPAAYQAMIDAVIND